MEISITQALLVRTVVSAVDYLAVLSDGGALVKAYAVTRKSIYKSFGSAGDLALCIGILDTKVKNSARLVRKSLPHHSLVHAAYVDKSRRAGRKTRDLCPLGQFARRIFFFKLFRSHRNIREKQLC